MGQYWPILGAMLRILGLCWSILRPMMARLTNLGPKIRNGQSRKSSNHRKTRKSLVAAGFLRQVGLSFFPRKTELSLTKTGP